MYLKFSKMHGLGNDFIIIDGISQTVAVEKIPIPTLADRHEGIGFDQLLLLERGQDSNFSCRIFNADGGEAEQCGNGMRCVARFIHEKKLDSKNTLRVETKAGLIEIDVKDFDNIRVNMGIPKVQIGQELNLYEKKMQLDVLSIGNPHAIIKVPAVKNFPVENLGPQISTHAFFPQGTNVGFMEVIDRQHIRLRTYERGTGETCACGSNSCAAVVSGIENNLLDNRVKVELALGNLWIEWAGKESPVFMTGPAVSVFEGEFKV